MDEMQDYEVAELYSVLKFSDRTQWETARLISYMVCLPYLKKKKSINDFLSLPWDEKQKEDEHRTEITTDEINNLREMASFFSKKLKESEGE